MVVIKLSVSRAYALLKNFQNQNLRNRLHQKIVGRKFDIASAWLFGEVDGLIVIRRRRYVLQPMVLVLENFGVGFGKFLKLMGLLQAAFPDYNWTFDQGYGTKFAVGERKRNAPLHPDARTIQHGRILIVEVDELSIYTFFETIFYHLGTQITNRYNKKNKKKNYLNCIESWGTRAR